MKMYWRAQLLSTSSIDFHVTPRLTHNNMMHSPSKTPSKSPPQPDLLDAAHTNTAVAFKHLANQPTVGLFYVSQHVRSSLPGLADNCRTLHTLEKTAQVGFWGLGPDVFVINTSDPHDHSI